MTQVDARTSPPPQLPLRVEAFAKAYDELVAVDDLSFHVQHGEILGLIGPNGAGKTTTLRAIAGIIPPTRGRIVIGGHDLARAPVAAKRVLAYVPDDPKLFDALTVREHLEFVAAAYQVHDWATKAQRLLEQFELTEKAGTISMELSRGMRQKVAICCAAIHDPMVILFDEPLTGLDPRGIRTIKRSMAQWASAGAAVIISSHLLAMVEDLCTHLLILHKGRSRFFGRLADARTAFAGQRQDASLEEVFFRATDGGAGDEAPVPEGQG